MINHDYRDDNSCCYFHPTEVVVGVCPLCLNEKLLVLAVKYHHHRHHRQTPTVNLPKIFAFGSLLHRLELKQYNKKSDHHSFSDNASTTQDQEESFILKFEDNGVASWDKGTVSKVSLDHCRVVSWKTKHKNVDQVNNIINKSTNNKTVIEHVKARASSLRWRKRIGHLFQVMRWKRSSKTSACHVSSKVVEGVKIRHKGGDWIRTPTKRRSKE